MCSKHGKHPGGESISQVIKEGCYFLLGPQLAGVRQLPGGPGGKAAVLEMLTEPEEKPQLQLGSRPLGKAGPGEASFWPYSHTLPSLF